MKKLTQKKLKQLFYYDSATGIFTHKVNKRGCRVGGVAGSKNARGYISISVCCKLYQAHRLAWLYVYGYLPENGIDHKNRIKNHNWISNLREVSQTCNMRNCGNPKTNTSGVKGVTWSKQRNKWATNISVNNKGKHLGCYKSFCNAVCARLAAEQCLDWSGCDSSSPAYQYVQKEIRNPI